MFERILRRLRDHVRRGEYLLTIHADEEMDAEEITGFDVEAAILNGQVVERQRDRTTRKAKYLVRGKGLDDQPIGVVAKISPTGRMVVLTVYRD